MIRLIRYDIRRYEPGQVVILATIALVVLLGSIAVATDIGLLWNRKRQMQTAADAAAVAAASTLITANNVCNNAGYAAVATNVTQLNGFTDGSNGVTVTPSCPPANGVYAGQSGYVEVHILQSVTTYFLRIVGITSLNVAARAVGGNRSAQNCVVILNPSVSGALSISGTSGTTLTTDCNVIVDSSSGSALSVGGGASLTAQNGAQVGVVGGYSGSVTPTPKTGIAPAPDPLSYLQAPTVGACNSTNGGCAISGNSGNLSVSGAGGCTGASCCGSGTVIGPTSVTLSPGVYCGGSTTTQSKGKPVTTYTPAISLTNSSGSVIFSPGTYILNGGNTDSSTGAVGTLYIAGQANATNTGGITFYDTGDATHPYAPVNIAGGATVNFTAPTSGTYTGILFFQDRSVPHDAFKDSISGGSNSSFTGTLYFPTTELDFSGSGGNTAYTIFVSDILHLGGGSSFTVHADYSALTTGSPLRETLLYE